LVIRERLRAQTGRSRSELFRLPLLLLGTLALAGFALDLAEILATPIPAWDVSLERAVQALPWGPLPAVFMSLDWVEGLRQVAVAAAGIVVVAIWRRPALPWGPLPAVFMSLDWVEGLRQVAVAAAGIVVVAIWRRPALPLMLWGAASAALYEGLELGIHRARPAASLVHVFRHTNGYAFPSGHTLFFTWFLAYLLLAFGGWLPRPARIAAWVAAAVFLALVAVGRVYSAEHWPSDVLGGLLLGVGWVALGLSIRRLSDPVLDAR
jgi:membrane-associated phospholipid phosphatase